MAYYLSEEAWETLGGNTHEAMWVDPKLKNNVAVVKNTIESNYRAWVQLKFTVTDQALIDLINYRESQYTVTPKGERNVFDPAIGRAIFYNGEQPRYKRGFTISSGAVNALAQWAREQQIWHRQRAMNPQGWASLALEVIGRGWIS